MKLLLFTILCLVAVLVIRFFQHLPVEKERRGKPGGDTPPTVASEDEIVDVRFEELEDERKNRDPRGEGRADS